MDGIVEIESPGAADYRAASLWDGHCHTEFGYCATTVSIKDCVKGARRAGLAGVSLTEHAWQIYTVPGVSPWEWDWWREPARLRELWAEGRGRMADYRREVEHWRGPDVALGTEVDVCRDGTLSLAPEDRDGWDVIVGAVHHLGKGEREYSEDHARGLFMDATTALLSQGARVLAHPFRWFVWGGRPMPTELFDAVVELCSRYGAAAEINTHGGNVNDPDFFRRCYEAGVKIALGTDSHAAEEIADMSGHLAVLEQAGIPEESRERALFRPLPNAGG